MCTCTCTCIYSILYTCIRIPVHVTWWGVLEVGCTAALTVLREREREEHATIQASLCACKESANLLNLRLDGLAVFAKGSDAVCVATASVVAVGGRRQTLSSAQ